MGISRSPGFFSTTAQQANAKDDYGWTPLHLASQYRGHPEERGLDVARLLLERGADAHVPDINHVTPLDLASRRGWSKMVQVLLEHMMVRFMFFIYMGEY
jgi:ankyrin repeat protein